MQRLTKILLALFILIPFNSNSQNFNKDNSFGWNGVFTFNIKKQFDEIKIIKPLPNGKIILGIHTWGMQKNDSFFVARLHPDGRLDSSYGTNGMTLVTKYTTDNITCMDVSSDGSVILGGLARFNIWTTEVLLEKLTPEGKFDNTFKGSGDFTIRINDADYSSCSTLVILDDGKILAAGQVNSQAALFRFHPDGEVDTEFGNNGTTILVENYQAIRHLKIRKDNSIVFGGNCLIADNYNIYAGACNDNGEEIISSRIIDLGSKTENLNEIEVFANGDILLIASTIQNDTDCIGIVKLNSVGDDLTAFGNSGKLYFKAKYHTLANEAVVLSDNRIVVSGTIVSSPGWFSDFLLLRLNHDGRIDSSFNEDGIIIPDLNDIDYAKALALLPDGSLLLGGYNKQYNYTAHDLILLKFRPYALSVGNPVEAKISAMIAPNPTEGFFTLNYYLNKHEETFQIILRDISGRTLLNLQNHQLGSAGEHSIEIAAPELPGIYFVQLLSKQGAATYKLIRL